MSLMKTFGRTRESPAALMRLIRPTPARCIAATMCRVAVEVKSSGDSRRAHGGGTDAETAHHCFVAWHDARDEVRIEYVAAHDVRAVGGFISRSRSNDCRHVVTMRGREANEM